jgi:hypothetical protein
VLPAAGLIVGTNAADPTWGGSGSSAAGDSRPTPAPEHWRLWAVVRGTLRDHRVNLSVIRP